MSGLSPPTVSRVARDINNEWASWLVRQMKRAGLPNTTDLARASGVDQSVISRWINEGRTPQVEQLRKVAGPLQTPLLHLLVRAGYLTRQEAEVEEAPFESISTDILTAIEHDIELLDEAREHLRNQYQLLRRLGPELSDPSRKQHTARPAAPRRRLRPVAYEGDPAHADLVDEIARKVREDYDRQQQQEREQKNDGTDMDKEHPDKERGNGGSANR